jgi:tetratricopeptide (TPR) repeat protein
LGAALAAGQTLQTPPQSPVQRLPQPLREQIESAVKAKDMQKAEQLLVDELNQRPDADLYKFLGGLFFLDKQYLNAGIALKKSDVMKPLDAPNRFTLAMCYVVLGMSDKARAEMTRLDAEKPGDPQYVYWLARIDYEQQKFEDAAAGFQKVTKMQPDLVKAWDNLGLTYEAIGKNEEAVAAYRMAVEKNNVRKPCSAWPGHNLAVLMRKLGQEEGVEPVLRQSIACEPTFAKSHYHLGLVLDKQGKPDEAIKSLRQASLHDPAYPEPHYALGRILRKQGKVEEARIELEAFQTLKARETGDTGRGPGQKVLP